MSFFNKNKAYQNIKLLNQHVLVGCFSYNKNKLPAFLFGEEGQYSHNSIS